MYPPIDSRIATRVPRSVRDWFSIALNLPPKLKEVYKDLSVPGPISTPHRGSPPFCRSSTSRCVARSPPRSAALSGNQTRFLTTSERLRTPMQRTQSLRIPARSYIQARSRYGVASLLLGRYCSFLRTRLCFAPGIGPLLLALLLRNAVRLLALPLPFPVLTLRVLIESLARTMLALLSHSRMSRDCKARAKRCDHTKMSYFCCLSLFSHFSLQ